MCSHNQQADTNLPDHILNGNVVKNAFQQEIVIVEIDIEGTGIWILNLSTGLYRANQWPFALDNGRNFPFVRKASSVELAHAQRRLKQIKEEKTQ